MSDTTRLTTTQAPGRFLAAQFAARGRTEADRAAWTIGDLQPYFDTALEAFGPERLMFGSDWPVCLLAATPGRWHETVRALAADLSMDERASLFGRTAVHAYGLDTGTQPNGV